MENEINEIEKIYYNKFKSLYIDSLFNNSLPKILNESIYSGDGFYINVLNGAKRAHKEMEVLFTEKINKKGD